MKNQLQLDSKDGQWHHVLGQQCKWCGHHMGLKGLYPVGLTMTIGGKKYRTMHCVCLECIAFDRRPKGFENIEAPLYNHLGKRVNGHEKVRVSFSLADAAHVRRMPAAAKGAVAGNTGT